MLKLQHFKKLLAFYGNYPRNTVAMRRPEIRVAGVKNNIF